MKCAVITGVSGQDGYLTANYLLSKDYKVIGLSRTKGRAIEHHNYFSKIIDFTIEETIKEFLAQNTDIDEIYHFAGISVPSLANANPNQAFRVNVAAVEVLLSSVFNNHPSCKVFLASSSSVFGAVRSSPQSEETLVAPNDVYGISKSCVIDMGNMWRRKGYFVSVGILYNHESRYRTEQFVTRKIVRAAKLIKEGKMNEVKLGNLDCVRDWSYAGDFVKGFHLTLLADRAGNYIFSSGNSYSVRDLCDLAFKKYGLNYKEYVKLDAEFYRACEPVAVVGDSTKAKKELGWEIKYSLEDLVNELALECEK